MMSDTNGEQNFIVLESKTCGFHVGFEGDGMNSVAVIKRPCNPHGGRMTGNVKCNLQAVIGNSASYT